MQNALTVTLFGHTINLATLAIALAFAILLYGFWRIQTSRRLDFTDMLTKDGRSVSLTKVLQLVGGVTGTWVVVKLALQGGITADIFGIYLAYVASVEGFSKFISAKYNYREASVRDRDDYPSYTPSYSQYQGYRPSQPRQAPGAATAKPPRTDADDLDDEGRPVER
jgi:hypothetical protein